MIWKPRDAEPSGIPRTLGRRDVPMQRSKWLTKFQADDDKTKSKIPILTIEEKFTELTERFRVPPSDIEIVSKEIVLIHSAYS